ncbi:fatty acid CoA ligase FadD32 [Nocardia amikacinitolerans]|uniref:Fatty acid CoA ligase FadD32 n=1 Tax=Nocardia amikacinitolerans TaxID=756689 RepID=A0A285LTH1_9NOCA|nr:fatty acyl-AMP ligase [Nocardia amikacinitolerans]SNY87407.1 fatty acid CoA ligase FadD32 [Nocardia amikacinitolerans]
MTTGFPSPLAARVAAWAATKPDAEAFIELRYRGTACEPRALTYAQLHRAAGALARRLREATEPGDRVAILCAHGLDYVVAFLACLYADRIAVPLFPVSGTRNTARLEGALADSCPALSLLSPGDTVTEASVGTSLGRIHYLPDELETADPVLDPVGAGPAYLQYTSGSTKAPAGVEVTHANLGAALEQLWTAVPAARHKPIVTWLPFFHDMGLVLALALPLYSGVLGVTMAPTEFVKRPIRWLRACADYRAGTTGGPNFGLALAVSGTTAQEREQLDLSALDALLNGAEPIRSEVLETFSKTFAANGFRHSAHTPGYGLAEATLSVTIGAQAAEPVTHRFDRVGLAEGRALVDETDAAGVPLVGCGFPAGQRVAVVDPAARTELPAAMVGEIWVAGPNVCGGYFGNPTATEETFGARLAGRAEHWLRTGDLGFTFDGQLYIAGRLKDLIVVDGRNHYPSDIESTVADHAPEVRPGHVTAFGHDDGRREDLVVVAELAAAAAEADVLADIARRIRAAVATAHEVMPGSVVLVEPGGIPKTSSGKLRRGECRRLFGAGRLPHLVTIGNRPTP